MPDLIRVHADDDPDPGVLSKLEPPQAPAASGSSYQGCSRFSQLRTRKEWPMCNPSKTWSWLLGAALALSLLPALLPSIVEGACCYFSAKDADILQPAQKAFLTWDPQRKQETFTVQPKFEGNAADF